MRSPNAKLVAKSRRIQVLHLIAKAMRVKFWVHGVPFGWDDPLEAMQRGPAFGTGECGPTEEP